MKRFTAYLLIGLGLGALTPFTLSAPMASGEPNGGKYSIDSGFLSLNLEPHPHDSPALKPAESAAKPPRKYRDPIQFYKPRFVDPPKVLLGDSGDGRCPDATQPCFKNNDDLLNGQTHILRQDDLVLGYKTGESLLLTDNSTITASSAKALADDSARYTWPAVAGARIFDLPSDVAVTVWEDRNNNLLLWSLDGSAVTFSSGTVPLPAQISDPNSFLSLVTGDFTGDGFDDVVVFLTAVGINGSAIVGTAVDPKQPGKGLKFGPAYLLSANNNIEPLKITAASVLGKPRVFVAGPQNFDLTGCASLHADIALESYTIDPDQLVLSSQGRVDVSVPEGPGACLNSIDIAAGRFNNALKDQLVVAFGLNALNVRVLPFDFNAQGLPVPGPVFDTGVAIVTGQAIIRSGRFDSGSPYDQAALLISNAIGNPTSNALRILSFDPNFNTISGPATTGALVTDCVNDLVVGNFDHQKNNPNPPPTLLHDPNLQLAVPFTDCTSAVEVRIFDVDPANKFQVSLNSVFPVTGPPGNNPVFLSTLAPVDLQGRSLRLGLPAKVTIENRSQVMTALAAPPMHVDALVPLDGGSQRPFNVSGVPAGFFATYSLSNADDNKTNTTNSTTWSFGAKETVSDKGEIGSCELGDCVDFGVKASAQQALDGSKTTLSGTFSTFDEKISFTTGFSDKVYYKDEALTIYVYPVIGRTVCPSSSPNCADAEKVPLVINMAGPDTQNSSVADGNILTWYQPPWMPGHLLSYPGNEAQLKAAAFRDPDDFMQLSQPQRWFTGDGTDNASATWTNGSISGSTSSFNQNYSFETDFSVSAKVGVGGLDTLSVGGDLDLSGSFGFSHLTDSSSTLSKTQGIEFSRTATFEDTNYGYNVSPYMFGQTQPGGVVDNKPLSADVNTFGALRTGHVVDIPSAGCCGFWSSWYGQAPDVGLNQPDHWQIATKTTDPGDGSCRTFQSGSSDVDCVQLGDRLPSNLPGEIWNSEFHTMRGLFITGPQGLGPQLITATTGDQLVLQARVYNLSLKDMPAGTQVHVRFMGMLWNTSNNTPVAASFRIGEQTVAAIAPFNSDPDTPNNWVLVPQAFDTSGANCGGQSCDNQDLVFWVAVWMEDGSGNIVAELPLHGLDAIPGDGADFLDVAGLEQTYSNKTYSNNLGFYNQVFHVFPKTSPVAAKAPMPPKGEVGAGIIKAGSESRNIRRGERTLVAAKVRTGSRDLNAGLKVAFFDGDPKTGGTLFGMHHVPHLRPDSIYDFRVAFRSDMCGRHDIYVVAGQGTRHEHTAKLKPIKVKCSKREHEHEHEHGRFPEDRLEAILDTTGD